MYTATIPGLSVAVGLAIGSIELLSVLVDKLSLKGRFWDLVVGVGLNQVVVLGVFALTWAVAVCVWHWAGIEEKWGASAEAAAASLTRGAWVLAGEVQSRSRDTRFEALLGSVDSLSRICRADLG